MLIIYLGRVQVGVLCEPLDRLRGGEVVEVEGGRGDVAVGCSRGARRHVVPNHVIVVVVISTCVTIRNFIKYSSH